MGCLIVVELQGKSGLPKDKYVNTFAIAESIPGNDARANSSELLAAAIDFYNGTNAALTGSLGDQMSGCISRVAGSSAVKLYDITGHLDGSPHGSPFDSTTFQLDGSSSTLGHPEEVALCCTLEAANRADQMVERADGSDPGTAVDRPRQRYTGRVYLGPWAAAHNVQEGTTNFSRPPAILTTGIREAMVRFATAIDAAGGGDVLGLGVWSRADQAIRGIDTVRTDDAWDTQRRRGCSPTAVTRTSTGELVPELELAS